MIRKLGYLFIVVVICFGCNSENAADCFQTSGNMVTQVVEVSDFSKIQVGEGVTLYIKQGDSNSVVIETGDNLLNDVSARVANGVLLLEDNNACNYVRDYAVTKIYVTAIDITAIINNSQFDVHSDGVLAFDCLELISDSLNYDSTAVGSFFLEVDLNSLLISFNNWSNATVSGNVTNLTVNLYSGASRFEGQNLIADKVSVYQRSSNDILVYPVSQLTGKIVSTGNIIAYHTPDVVSVETPYIGDLIFAD